MLQATQGATFSSISSAIDAIRDGRPVIVVDSEDRENEGDFLMAAELVTPDIMHFMMSQARGQVCVPILNNVAQRLGLRRMIEDPQEPNSPAFTIPIDHRAGSTGVSPEDRVQTIRAIADATSRAEDFIRPGHSFPLIAREGGVLVRPGHTESAIDLLRMAGLVPVGTLCEICSRDGRSMAQRDELMELAAEFDLSIITIDELIEIRRREASSAPVSRHSIIISRDSAAPAAPAAPVAPAPATNAGPHANGSSHPQIVFNLGRKPVRKSWLSESRLSEQRRSQLKRLIRLGGPGQSLSNNRRLDRLPTAGPRVEIPAELKPWIERYDRSGRRNRHMWDWTWRGIMATTLSCVDSSWCERVNITKFLGVMLVVLLDDAADEHGSKRFTEQLLKIFTTACRPEFSEFGGVERQYASLCLQLWEEMETRVTTFPRQTEFAEILDFDYRQLSNAMCYSSLLKRQPELLNLAEHDLYLPHNMYMMVLSTLDLMCSPAFDRDELGGLREAVWHAQWMGRIGNLVTTWQRELGEQDYSSGVFARAMSHGDISPQMIRDRDCGRLRTAIQLGRHEEYFYGQWWQHRRWLVDCALKFRSVDLEKVIAGLDQLIRLDQQLAWRGSKRAHQADPVKQRMKILLASPRGFCAGVNMAIESLQRAVDLYGTPFYVYHEIVHNRHVVETFRGRGVVFVDSIEDVPRGSYLMYSAHGVAPSIRRLAQARELRTIDATCPLVNKVHSEALRFARQGYTIILIGHRGHDEVVGTLGEKPDSMMLVETPADVNHIQPPDPNRVAYLTQTTLSVDEVARIVSRLRERFPRIQGPASEDICYATQNRQDALKSLLPDCDVVLVLGSRNSSNSNRLLEIARDHLKPAYLIDDASEIQPDWFVGDETVLVTAGASAPESTVRECVDYLQQNYEAAVSERVLGREKVKFALPRELAEVSDARAL